MVKRPRSHQLEEESWKTLSNSIPNQWVLRKPVPDYGIDGEVEIFDKSGLSTGLMFFVQLKGTDIKDKTKALSCRISLRTRSYYRSLPVPVLIIRYHSLSKSIYFKWIGDTDPYYTRKGSKTIKVDFPEETRWTEKTPDLLVEYIKLFKKFTDPVITLPIEFRFEFPDKEVFSFPVSIVESIIRKAGDSVSEIISFSGQGGSLEPSPRIKITNELIVIEIEGLNGFTLHLKNGYPKDQVKTKMPHDVFAGISYLMHILGQNNLAAEVASKHILSSSLLSNERFIFEICWCFFFARRIDMVLKLSEQLLNMGDKYSQIFDIFSLPIARKVYMSSTDLEDFNRVFLKAIDKAKEAGNLIRAGTLHYNLGNRIVNSQRNYREAFHHYHMASKYNPSYLIRNYFWSEAGGILFSLNKYLYSERFYLKALKLGADLKYIALRADALMFAGKYGEAFTLFREYETVSKEIDDEWALKSWILGGLITNLGIEIQRRYPREAMKAANTTAVGSQEEEKKIADALALDALCGLAWFNNGVHMASKKEYKEAMISFLIAAIVQPNDTEAWSNAVFCSFNYNPEFVNLLLSILSVAYEKNGEEFFLKFALALEKQPFPDELMTETANLISAFGKELAEGKREIPILRLTKPDGTYEEIDLNLKSTKDQIKGTSFPEFPRLSFLGEKGKR